jgi:hypothetical protein
MRHEVDSAHEEMGTHASINLHKEKKQRKKKIGAQARAIIMISVAIERNRSAQVNPGLGTAKTPAESVL